MPHRIIIRDHSSYIRGNSIDIKVFMFWVQLSHHFHCNNNLHHYKRILRQPTPSIIDCDNVIINKCTVIALVFPSFGKNTAVTESWYFPFRKVKCPYASFILQFVRCINVNSYSCPGGYGWRCRHTRSMFLLWDVQRNILLHFSW
jgi:hypothetical protein